MSDSSTGPDDDPMGVLGVSAGGALAALYRSRTLYVQRKAGALSYTDDPSGVRSLLSTAFYKVGRQHFLLSPATLSFLESEAVQTA